MNSIDKETEMAVTFFFFKPPLQFSPAQTSWKDRCYGSHVLKRSALSLKKVQVPIVRLSFGLIPNTARSWTGQLEDKHSPKKHPGSWNQYKIAKNSLQCIIA